jgi:threonine dehydrogenase-like Zn-dependent dehydrogenase
MENDFFCMLSKIPGRPKKTSHKEDFLIPDTNLVWNLYGAGYDKFGNNGYPESVPTPHPDSDQLLVRIDCVGICYSDVKLLHQGENHPKLKKKNLSIQPIRPGHEVSFTVVVVGDKLKEQFQVGERYVVQPEVVHQHKKLTYGFSFDGGLTQYQLIGPELLCTDDGISILKVDDTLGFAEASLLEPLGSVLSSYENTRRLVPKQGGKMWIIGNPQSQTEFVFTRYLDYPETVLISDLPPSLKKSVLRTNSNVLIQDGIEVSHYISSIDNADPTLKFDDIVVIDPQSAEQIEILLSMINPGGLINLIGANPLEEPVLLDPQRIHYDFISIIGNKGPDLADSYGTERNRSEFSPHGTAVFYGAGGPMGQMHIERAITILNGPEKLVVIDVNQERLNYIQLRFSRMAQQYNKTLYIINPLFCDNNLNKHIIELTNQKYVEDLIVLVPDPGVLEDAVSLLGKQSLINLFAGTPAGSCFPIDISNVYLGNMQITGSSGLGFQHICTAYEFAIDGKIDLGASVAAVGGMGAALEAIRAADERRFPGKIVIYPQLVNLPLMSIGELKAKIPAIANALGENCLWTRETERILLNEKM